jgi:hypothetical protein
MGTLLVSLQAKVLPFPFSVLDVRVCIVGEKMPGRANALPGVEKDSGDVLLTGLG